MAMTNEDTISVLNDLIETCKDGEYGFRTCAEHVQSPELEFLLAQRAIQCQQSAEVLQREAVQLGGEPDLGGTAAGAVHRGWVALRGALTGYSDPAMLEECERGEDIAMKRYLSALERDLSGPLRLLINTQYQGVRRNHDQVRALRDRYKATI